MTKQVKLLLGIIFLVAFLLGVIIGNSSKKIELSSKPLALDSQNVCNGFSSYQGFEVNNNEKICPVCHNKFDKNYGWGYNLGGHVYKKEKKDLNYFCSYYCARQRAMMHEFRHYNWKD